MRSMSYAPGLYLDLDHGGIVAVSTSARGQWYGESVSLRGGRLVRTYVGHRAWKLKPVDVQEATEILTGIGGS